MKRYLLFTICILFVLSIAIPMYTSDTSKVDEPDKQALLAKLAPYQAVIDKINKEYGASINIPEDGLMEVYNNIKDTPIEEYEANLRRDYLSVKDSPIYTYIDGKGNIYHSNTEINFPPVK